MKISNQEKGIVIDGQGFLTIAPAGDGYVLHDARDSHEVRVHVQHFNFVRPKGRTRLGRLYSLLKHVWKYTA